MLTHDDLAPYAASLMELLDYLQKTLKSVAAGEEMIDVRLLGHALLHIESYALGKWNLDLLTLDCFSEVQKKHAARLAAQIEHARPVLAQSPDGGEDSVDLLPWGQIFQVLRQTWRQRRVPKIEEAKDG